MQDVHRQDGARRYGRLMLGFPDILNKPHRFKGMNRPSRPHAMPLLALANAIFTHIVDQGWHDQDFIEAHTLREAADRPRFSPRAARRMFQVSHGR